MIKAKIVPNIIEIDKFLNVLLYYMVFAQSCQMGKVRANPARTNDVGLAGVYILPSCKSQIGKHIS